MWRLADQVQATGVKDACIAALAALPIDTLCNDLLLDVFELVASTAVAPGQQAHQQLLDTCVARVATMCTNVLAAASDAHMLQLFCALPFGSVKAWAASDDLIVDW